MGVTVEQYLWRWRGGGGDRRWRRASGWEKRWSINNDDANSSNGAIDGGDDQVDTPDNYAARVGRPKGAVHPSSRQKLCRCCTKEQINQL